MFQQESKNITRTAHISADFFTPQALQPPASTVSVISSQTPCVIRTKSGSKIQGWPQG